ncbi:probable CDP-diacylglycerol--inositol 3-phosphatidyltransferase 2 isoform X1 [Diospyros lotus]|uniref:probable CDP-diacylglycerol--inositol 3-phosphatidyltransferase 2 isoform X1 n=1 Tax=Diospyros lotus TaxID=55363 RepID=UPI002254CC90|nr:probable CDP-diacylglycerol--inositol 3-phosphatidyltransferase 2 isoform X1 [Diospyros lotus]
MANQKSRVSVYLYIPNIIGYARILLNCVAFYISYSDKKLFSVLYFISFVCDALDGWFARKFNQVSTFGAVLDMVTDRISTACLLVILSQIYRPGLVFLSLFALDIASHWLQMYSTFLVGKVSHKDVKDSNNWLFKAYYGNRMFMGYCCVACEVLYIILFLLAKNQNENLTNVIADAAYQSSVLLVLIILLLVGWAIKQAVNVIQAVYLSAVLLVGKVGLKQTATLIIPALSANI